MSKPELTPEQNSFISFLGDNGLKHGFSGIEVLKKLMTTTQDYLDSNSITSFEQLKPGNVLQKYKTFLSGLKATKEGTILKTLTMEDIQRGWDTFNENEKKERTERRG